MQYQQQYHSRELIPSLAVYILTLLLTLNVISYHLDFNDRKQAHPSPFYQFGDLKPWTTRSTAPTDYKLVQRRAANEKNYIIGRCTSFRSIHDKYQVALEVSGLSSSQLLKERNVKTTRAFILGIALYVTTLLLQFTHHPLDIGTFRLELQVSSKFTSLLRAVNNLATIENNFSSIPSYGNESSAIDRDKLLSKPSPYCDRFDPPVSEHDENGLFDETTFYDPSASADVINNTTSPATNNIDFNVRHLFEGRRVVETLTSVETEVASHLSPPRGDDFSLHDLDERQPLLKIDKMTKTRTHPAAWVQHTVKRCSARSRQVISGMKNKAHRSLLLFRKEYIALVENDNFFL